MSAFLDLGRLTFEALVQMQDKLYERLAFATSSGSGALIENLMRQLREVDDEMIFRAAKEAAEHHIENSPLVIETDPDLAKLHKKEIDAVNEDEVTPEPRRRIPTRRSQRPLSPDDL